VKRKLKLNKQIIRIKIKLLIVTIITNNKIEKILLLKDKKLSKVKRLKKIKNLKRLNKAIIKRN
jgi:hypothetical protein